MTTRPAPTLPTSAAAAAVTPVATTSTAAAAPARGGLPAEHLASHITVATRLYESLDSATTVVGGKLHEAMARAHQDLQRFGQNIHAHHITEHTADCIRRLCMTLKSYRQTEFGRKVSLHWLFLLLGFVCVGLQMGGVVLSALDYIPNETFYFIMFVAGTMKIHSDQYYATMQQLCLITFVLSLISYIITTVGLLQLTTSDSINNAVGTFTSSTTDVALLILTNLVLLFAICLSVFSYQINTAHKAEWAIDHRHVDAVTQDKHMDNLGAICNNSVAHPDDVNKAVAAVQEAKNK